MHPRRQVCHSTVTNHDKNTVGGAVNALLSFTQASWLGVIIPNRVA